MSNQTQPGKLPEEIEQDIFNLVEKYLPPDKHHLTPNEAVEAVTVYAEKWWEVKQKFSKLFLEKQVLFQEKNRLMELAELLADALQYVQSHGADDQLGSAVVDTTLATWNKYQNNALAEKGKEGEQ